MTWDIPPVSEDVTVELNAFATLEFADSYFNNMLGADSWKDASQDDKKRSLNTATNLMLVLEYIEVYTIESHPDIFDEACCDIALQLLDIDNLELLRDRQFYKSQKFGDVSTTYKDNEPAYVMAGIPSAVAWDKLRPYLKPVDTFNVLKMS